MINKKSKLEIAANQSQIDSKIVLDIYKQFPFSLNTLINAKVFIKLWMELKLDHWFIKSIC